MSNLDFSFSFLCKRAENLTAFKTVKSNPFEHRPDSSATSDDTGNLDETIQLVLSEIAKRGSSGELRDTYMYVRVNLVVRRKVEENDF